MDRADVSGWLFRSSRAGCQKSKVIVRLTSARPVRPVAVSSETAWLMVSPCRPKT